MVTVEESYLPISLSAPDLTDHGFRDLCDKYSDYRVEYTADGELIIMSPTDPKTGARNAAITMRLRFWADTAKRGIVTDSSGGFVLPNHARRAPDAAWMSRETFRKATTCPEFVIELISPFDQRRKAHLKMLEWIENGALLGWMIDPDRKTVSIYRPDRDVEVRIGIMQIEGEGPVSGFVLDLREIWDVQPFG